MTFLVHLNEVYIRHEGAPDVPFVKLNKTTLELNTEAAPIEHAEGSEKKMIWPREGLVPDETEEGKRYMGLAPLASDGKFIYAIVTYRKDDEKSEIVAVYVEQYEFTNNAVNFVKDFKLLEENDSNWIGKCKTDTEHLGYFDHGHFATNGELVVWHSLRNVHIFSLKKGNRVKKQHVHGGKHLACFESSSSKWYSQDADVYSWLDEWDIIGF